jgi:hypothetical protein
MYGDEWTASRPGRFTSQGKCTWYPLDRRLGGLQSRSGPGVEEKNFQPLPGLERPIIQPVGQSYTTELSRFLLVIYDIKLFMTLAAMWLIRAVRK